MIDLSSRLGETYLLHSVGALLCLKSIPPEAARSYRTQERERANLRLKALLWSWEHDRDLAADWIAYNEDIDRTMGKDVDSLRSEYWREKWKGYCQYLVKEGGYNE
jgi:hypothetical protein